jgi:hypothetical protein
MSIIKIVPLQTEVGAGSVIMNSKFLEGPVCHPCKARARTKLHAKQTFTTLAKGNDAPWATKLTDARPCFGPSMKR